MDDSAEQIQSNLGWQIAVSGRIRSRFRTVVGRNDGNWQAAGWPHLCSQWLQAYSALFQKGNDLRVHNEINRRPKINCESRASKSNDLKNSIESPSPSIYFKQEINIISWDACHVRNHELAEVLNFSHYNCLKSSLFQTPPPLTVFFCFKKLMTS